LLGYEDINLLNETLLQIKELYPGWVMRLYTHVTPAINEPLCNLLCQHQHFDLCDVSKLKDNMVISQNKEWSGWRWWVLGDPLVAVWETRKLNMAITPREAHAVTQFINSEKCWHVQRDHELQKGLLGAGFLGGKAAWGQEDLINLRQHLLNELSRHEDEDKILEDILEPLLQQDTMVHSSILCWQDSGAVPFPSKRRPGEWIGMTLDQQKSIKNIERKRFTHKKISDMKEKKGMKIIQEERTVPENMNDMKIVINSTENTEKNWNRNNMKIPFKSIMIEYNNVKKIVKSKMQEIEEENKVKQHNHTVQMIKKKQNSSLNSLGKTTMVPAALLSEHDINLSLGITTCPGQCRPLLHPDWEYC
ncbi:unnamed protein product, partial [Meganyctiphanes norvegica]